MLYFVTDNCICITNEQDAIIRTKALEKCYSLPGYKDLSLDNKNKIYDRIIKELTEV